jgi:hypothetical protein
MSIFIIDRSLFDWPKFADAIGQFTASLGGDEVFPIVEDGKVIFAADHEELTLPDGMELEDISDDPIERLEAGFDLLAHFAMPQDFGEFACADGNTIEVPDLDQEEFDEKDEDAEERPTWTDEERKLIEDTEWDDCHSYGILISLTGAKLFFQTVRVTELGGPCEAEAVEHAGLVEKPMTKFINFFMKKPARRKP